MLNHTQLLSEHLRPRHLADLNLPDPLLGSLERMVKRGSILNLLFYGKPGIGKTSAARILLREIEADVYELNW
jgi:replication-associated recombination protein RarA